MKKLLFILVAVALIAGCTQPAAAETVTTQYFDKDTNLWFDKSETRKLDVTVHDPVVVDDDDREAFDYGTFLDLVLYETKDKKIQIVNKNTWEVNRKEITSLVGAKINVWSIFKKEPKTTETTE